MWFETSRFELVLGRTLCLDASNNVAPKLSKCHELGGSQEWKHKGSVSILLNPTLVSVIKIANNPFLVTSIYPNNPGKLLKYLILITNLLYVQRKRNQSAFGTLIGRG